MCCALTVLWGQGGIGGRSGPERQIRGTKPGEPSAATDRNRYDRDLTTSWGVSCVGHPMGSSTVLREDVHNTGCGHALRSGLIISGSILPVLVPRAVVRCTFLRHVMVCVPCVRAARGVGNAKWIQEVGLRLTLWHSIQCARRRAVNHERLFTYFRPVHLAVIKGCSLLAELHRCNHLYPAPP